MDRQQRVTPPGPAGDSCTVVVSSDAVLLVYDTKAGKVWSLDAEGTAPKLATIEWYGKN
jgi:hypothetical protein